MKSGKLYFLRRADGLIKIGYTANLTRRLEALTKSHGILEVIRVINGDKHREKRLHSQFRRFNEYGEWFRPDPTLISEILALNEGTAVEVVKDDIDKLWLAGDRMLADEAKSLVERLIQTRRQRTGLKLDPAMKAVCAHHSLRLWSVHNLHLGRPTSVTAFTLKKLREALVAEMSAFKDELERELETEAVGEVRRLVARVEAKKAERAVR